MSLDLKKSTSSPGLSKMDRDRQESAKQIMMDADRGRAASVHDDVSITELHRLMAELPMLAIPGIGPKVRSMHQVASRSGISSFEEMPSLAMWAETNMSRDASDMSTGMMSHEVHDKLTAPLCVAVFHATIGAFMFGWNIGVLNYPGDTIKDDLNGTDVLWSTVVAIFAIGGMVGSYAAGILADVHGRKIFVIFNAFTFIAASFLSFFSQDCYMLMGARFLFGYGAGGASVVAPLYLGEVSPANLRGMLGTLNQFAVCIGILLSNVISFPLNASPEWRYLLAAGAVPAILQLLGSPFMLESPRWLAMKGREQEAESNLKQFRGTENVGFDMECMTAPQKDSGSGVGALLNDTSVRRQVYVGVTLNIIQQFAGINAVFYYSSSFFQEAGVDNTFIPTVLASGINVIATGIATSLMDRLGRRLLLLISSAGMFLSCLILTFALLNIDHDKQLYGGVAIAGIMLYVTSFEFGLGPIPWLIVAEIFPSEHRSSAMGLASTLNWASNFIVGMLFPSMNDLLGSYVFLPFAAVTFSSVIFVQNFVYETKNRSIEDILELYSQGQRKSVNQEVPYEKLEGKENYA